MKNGKLIIACAGAGKTTQLVSDVLSLGEEKRVLITTFTDSNIDTIKNKFIKKLAYVPENIRIMPIYSFELKELIKPYLLPFIKSDIRKILMVPQKERCWKSNNEKYYLYGNGIYKDKISELAFRTVKASSRTIKRLSEIFDYIFLDEAQDLAGYDLDLMVKFAQSGFKITLYADPRQSTFKTSNGSKNSGFRDICDYLRKKAPSYFDIGENTLNGSQRCPGSVMKVASQLFPMYPQSSGTKAIGNIYLVEKSKCDDFLRQHPKCQGLCRNRRCKTDGIGIPFKNIGVSKGATYESTLLIIPPAWVKCIINGDFSGMVNTPKSLADLYIALTRSLGDVGIVTDTSTIVSCKNMDVKVF